jgi:hypothetical protein
MLTCGSGCSPQWQVVGVGDFNGDGYADVLWFNASTGQLSYWLLDGQGNVMATPILPLPCDFLRNPSIWLDRPRGVTPCSIRPRRRQG